MPACLPDSSAGKESACNAGDPGSIPGSGSSLGEGIGYPLQYSWASLVTQMVKKLLAMQEIPVQSLGWKDPRENGNPFQRILWIEKLDGLQSMGLQRVG